MLLCPVCHEPLVDNERGAACAGGHRFDRAREGYLYLLRSSKSGDSMGDPKSQARSRRDFLNRGYYAPLRDAMVELVRERVSGRAASTNDPMTLLVISLALGFAQIIFGLLIAMHANWKSGDKTAPTYVKIPGVGSVDGIRDAIFRAVGA